MGEPLRICHRCGNLDTCPLETCAYEHLRALTREALAEHMRSTEAAARAARSEWMRRVFRAA